MNKHKIFIRIILAEGIILLMLFLYGSFATKERARIELPAKRELAASLMLTDLSLWTEARYTRHPSQADWFTPFQDFPASFEHFPAGSLIAPGTFAIDPVLPSR